ncbi:glutamine amidotransferase [Herbiconiux sp. CPCC 203407]|uniref:Glutamine amidotransferase n=1 Tax=Herbiconiux oxytropis TaxID=2970915 RepID=A0AA41XJ73_9MICO|nr:glutamine amidotransferase [Herbiconiux oxytropis]MCS5722768.1 glutamine amidotransferase [Herbiconiux oxytropis]MCS5727038.1 glutamine amidotransferase [Herbiconiux oxytropis]
MSADASVRASRRAAVVQHSAAVGLGNFGPVLEARGYEIEIVEVLVGHSADEVGAALERVADAEVLIVLGSTAGVYEADRHPFIAPEIAFVRARLEEERPTLGVCFGAQVIAAALGEEVRQGPSPEVGYRSVEPTAAGRSSPVRHVTGIPMAQWHGDTFDLPAATTLLASSEAYENQAFGIGDWLLAVQFHPELTDAMHEEWLAADAAYLRRHGIDADSLRAERAQYGAGQQVASARLLAEYLDGLEQGERDGRGGPSDSRTHRSPAS